MIKLESAHIEEVRGIRKLEINFQQKPFAISGQNGSGKSGVVDAVAFGITGATSRLTGRGTNGLSVAEHGPDAQADLPLEEGPVGALRPRQRSVTSLYNRYGQPGQERLTATRKAELQRLKRDVKDEDRFATGQIPNGVDGPVAKLRGT